MATAAEILPELEVRAEESAAEGLEQDAGSRISPVLVPWVRTQSINVARHLTALRPFGGDEFGTGAAAPTPGHLAAANGLISSLRGGLLQMTRGVAKAATAAKNNPGSV